MAFFFSGRKYASILGCGVTSTDTGVVEFKLLLVTVDVKCWSIDGDCFLLEGWFKNVKDLHDGTTNLSGQIANNLSFKLKVHFELNDITIRKPELKAFVEQISTNKDNTRLLLHEPRFTKQICTFTKKEQDILKKKLKLAWNSSVIFSHTATINNISN